MGAPAQLQLPSDPTDAARSYLEPSSAGQVKPPSLGSGRAARRGNPPETPPGPRAVLEGGGTPCRPPPGTHTVRWGSMWVTALLLLLVLLLLVLLLGRRGASRLEPAGRAVLITGCDSGFGHLLALRLHRLGFTVFAGCLCPGGAGARRLQREAAAGAGRLRVLRLDVTCGRDVQAAKELVLSHLPERGERREPPDPSQGSGRLAEGSGVLGQCAPRGCVRCDGEGRGFGEPGGRVLGLAAGETPGGRDPPGSPWVAGRGKRQGTRQRT